MPNIATKVSVEITPEKEVVLKEKLGQAISLLKGKSARTSCEFFVNSQSI